jgi:flagellar biosynthesis regulator FlbT
MSEKNKLLNKLKKDFDNLNKEHHIEILHIFLKHDPKLLTIKKNKEILTNLKNVDEKILDEIFKYLKFIKEQENEMSKFEEEVNTVKESYFS